uniref:Uncharacterized protein n=1 Tax=Pithovirus LCPAC101 TaxID=2506586 RepID=A0A481Z3J8_9VIRU|nr:MAG: hypothetical protein LCPAC101_02240 [Pithovirus LCPAC101]
MVHIELSMDDFFDMFEEYLSITFSKSEFIIGESSNNYVVKACITPNEYRKYLDKYYTGQDDVMTTMMSIEGGLRLKNYVETDDNYFQVDTFTEVSKTISGLIIRSNSYK